MHDLSATPLRLLDGGLSTQLERGGHTPTGTLWTAEQLLGHVDTIVVAHRAFVAAGAEVLITSSYQLSHRALSDRGIVGADADAVFVASTAAARIAAETSDQQLAAAAESERFSDEARTAAQAARGPVAVAASVGPYGATLADGSEYVGTYELSYRQLRAFHQQRLETLIDTGPDLLAIETIPSLQELEAIAEALDDLGATTPAWWSMTPSDAVTFRTGEALGRANEVIASTRNPVAVGVNCAAIGTCLDALDDLATSANAPLIVYPNAGGSWNATTRQWDRIVDPNADPDDDRADRGSWVERAQSAGATIIGGCCGTDAAAIAAIGLLLRRS